MCQGGGYAERRREAGQRYQQSEAGRLNHAVRQRQYRRDHRPFGRPPKKSVTQGGTTPEATPVSPAPEPEGLTIRATKRLVVTSGGGRHSFTPRCAFCAALVGLLPAYPEGRSLRNIETRRRRRT